MKRLSTILSLSLLALLAAAQPNQFPPERTNDDEIIRMQIRDIVSRLDLDKRTEEKFIKEYTAFRNEIDTIAKNARPPQGLKDETEIDNAIRQNFAVSEQILQIRKKYYVRFKEFMKPSQIQMLYHFENEEGRRMHYGPGRPGGPEWHDGPENRPGGPERHDRPDDRPAPPPQGQL